MNLPYAREVSPIRMRFERRRPLAWARLKWALALFLIVVVLEWLWLVWPL